MTARNLTYPYLPQQQKYIISWWHLHCHAVAVDYSETIIEIQIRLTKGIKIVILMPFMLFSN
jgi:hypothetical protein